jgi:nitrogen-specific signal transduction histidine kinase
MNLSSRSRLIALIGTMLCLAVLVVLAASTSWIRSRDVRRHFERIESESLQYDTERLRALILNTTETLLTFEVTDRQEDRQKFDEVHKELGVWIESTRAALMTGDEKAIFEEIYAAYNRYMAESTALADANPIEEPKEVMVDRFAQIQHASDQLLTLTNKLANVRRLALGQAIRKSEKSVVVLQQVVFGSLLAFIVLTAWGAHVIYRDTIAPLKLKLVETREIAERQEKLASLGVLAAGVAHEIRNPLTAIKARLFTQKKALVSGTSAYTDGEFIAQEISRLERIVRDFLAFARPAPLQRETISSSALFGQVRELLEPQLKENAIELAVEPDETPLEIDSQQVRQVLINLVQNAADSIGENGHIKLRSRSAKIALSEHIRQAVILEVEDDGKGIPTEVQQRLFDPFFSTKANGTGLGLSIAARIAQQHGGALRYQTQLHRGTTFGIILPAKAES